MKAILRGSEIKSKEDFYNQIKTILELPNFYGNNLDALWDCLTGWIETPLILEWIDFDISEAYLGDYAIKILNLFENAEKEVEGFVFRCY
jgi:Barstar, RNAse (barnase) inhibitor